MQIIDPIELLRTMPPGSALYARERIDTGAWEVAWLVREETKRIQALGKSPAVSFRAGLWPFDNVMLIPVLVQVGPETPETIYESWINVHATGQQNPLEDLAMQPRIVVHLYGDACQLVRSLTVSNQLQMFAREALLKLRDGQPWSMQAFDAAREEIYAKHATVWDLWQALELKP